MDEVGKIKRQVAVYGLIFIALCQVVSLFLIGFDARFTIFLIAGLAAALINFNLLSFFLKKMLESGNSGFSSISFCIRILIYCGVFFIAIRQSTVAGAACLLGILGSKLPLYYFHAIKPKFDTKRKVRPEVQAMYDKEDQEKEDEFWGKEKEE